MNQLSLPAPWSLSHSRLPTAARRVVGPQWLMALALWVGVHGVGGAAPDGLQLLAAAARAEHDLTLVGNRQVTLWAEGQSKVTLQEQVVQGGGGRLRVKTLGPRGQAERLLISDGRLLWEYLPGQKRLLRHTLPNSRERARRLQQSLTLISSNLRVTYKGLNSIAGRSAHVVVLTNPAGDLVRQYWLDTHNSLELRVDVYQPGGGLYSRTLYTALDLSPRLSSQTFNFRPPAGLKVETAAAPASPLSLAKAEQQVGFSACLPTYLPSGFTFLHDEVAVNRQSPTQGPRLWLVFSNGVDRFSLFQSRQGCGGSSRDGIACWQANGYHYTLIGNLAPGEITRLKASMRPR
jgi:outer membrane lipoprotein-sorting protein